MKSKLSKRSLLAFMALVLAMSFLPVTAPSAHATNFLWVGYGIGPGSYATIQGAINVAINGDIITVADGTYCEYIDFLGKAITVQSENGPDSTIIDRGCVGYEGSAVYFDSGEGRDSVLSGFTIKNAYQIYAGGGDPGDNGAGILIQWTSPTITNCIIRDNRATGVGAGIAIAGNSVSEVASPLIEDCIITHNGFGIGWPVYGGGIAVVGPWAEPVIVNTIIENNSAQNGGGIAFITHGVPVGPGANVWMRNVIVKDNSAARAGNDHGLGGGIYAENADVKIANFTIVNNATSLL